MEPLGLRSRKLHSTVCSQVAGGLLSRLTSRKIHLWSRSSRKQCEKRIRLRRLVESGNFQFVNHVSIRNPIPILDQIGSGHRWLWKTVLQTRFSYKKHKRKLCTPLTPFLKGCYFPSSLYFSYFLARGRSCR